MGGGGGAGERAWVGSGSVGGLLGVAALDEELCSAVKRRLFPIDWNIRLHGGGGGVGGKMERLMT